ncbi:MAG: MFS transporter [Caulobacterales bacterium]
MSPSTRPLPNAWLVLALLLAIALLNYADRYLISGLISHIQKDFSTGDSYIGLLMGPAFAVLYTTLAVPFGWLADRWSRIGVIATGCIIWSVFTVLSGFADNAGHLVLARIGVGIGEAAFSAPAYALVAEYFAPERRTRAFAILGLSVYVGQIAGTVAGPALAETAGWRTAFFVVGAPGIFVALLAWLIVRDPPRARPAVQAGRSAFALAHAFARSRCFTFATLGMAFGLLAGVSFGMWGPTLFARAYALDAKSAAALFGLAFGASGMAGMLAFGALADHQVRRSLRAPLQLAAIALAAASAVTLAVTWAPSQSLALGLALLGGLFGGGWSIGVTVTMQHLLPADIRATGTAALMMIASFVGVVFGPWVAGALSEAVGQGLFGGGQGVNAAAFGLRVGLSATIVTGFLGSILLWRAARSLDKDREVFWGAAPAP